MPVMTTRENIREFLDSAPFSTQKEESVNAIMQRMRRATNEIEVKLPFDSVEVARERIASAGARAKSARRFEDNAVFDRPVEPLAGTGILLRLRRTDGRALLTLKRPVSGAHRHKVREEHETAVADPDAVTRILDGLGLRIAYRYQKYRTLFELGGVELALDETPLGCFVELEGEPDRIDEVASRLGYGPDRYVLDTYLDLHERAARERGVPRGDLLIEPGSERR
jgi:adenylate cyclase class 2